ncbi:hypothetical protein PINS_up011643 [Pythium insidiosum]|nr:hypothetical protein PINS_up011643 [Pythium insidiosum]
MWPLVNNLVAREVNKPALFCCETYKLNALLQADDIKINESAAALVQESLFLDQEQLLSSYSNEKAHLALAAAARTCCRTGAASRN